MKTVTTQRKVHYDHAIFSLDHANINCRPPPLKNPHIVDLFKLLATLVGLSTARRVIKPIANDKLRNSRLPTSIKKFAQIALLVLNLRLSFYPAVYGCKCTEALFIDVRLSKDFSSPELPFYGNNQISRNHVAANFV